MNGIIKIFGDRYLPHMTTNVAESHMTMLSISKDLIKQALKDLLYIYNYTGDVMRVVTAFLLMVSEVKYV